MWVITNDNDSLWLDIDYKTWTVVRKQMTQRCDIRLVLLRKKSLCTETTWRWLWSTFNGVSRQEKSITE